MKKVFYIAIVGVLFCQLGKAMPPTRPNPGSGNGGAISASREEAALGEARVPGHLVTAEQYERYEAFLAERLKHAPRRFTPGRLFHVSLPANPEKGRDKTDLYILGTVHTVPLATIDPAILDIFETAPAIYLESNMADFFTQLAPCASAEKGGLDVFDPEARTMLEKGLQPFLDIFSPETPLNGIAATDIIYAVNVLEGFTGMDTHLSLLWQVEGKRVFYLDKPLESYWEMHAEMLRKMHEGARDSYKKHLPEADYVLLTKKMYEILCATKAHEERLQDGFMRELSPECFESYGIPIPEPLHEKEFQAFMPLLKEKLASAGCKLEKGFEVVGFCVESALLQLMERDLPVFLRLRMREMLNRQRIDTPYRYDDLREMWDDFQSQQKAIKIPTATDALEDYGLEGQDAVLYADFEVRNARFMSLLKKAPPGSAVAVGITHVSPLLLLFQKMGGTVEEIKFGLS